MADLTVTAANVLAASGSTKITGIGGQTITAGQAVYLDSTDDEYKLVDNDASGTAAVAGITLNGCGDGQPLEICTAGNINPGATVAVGTIYCSSSTAGGIAPSMDNATGDYTSILGIATTTSNILLNIQNGGVVIP